jgi:RNA polymerase sigma-70 factor (ECF subfamily)
MAVSPTFSSRWRPSDVEGAVEEASLSSPECDPTERSSGKLDPDQASFAGVVNEHWTAVYRLLYCLAGNAHDAEDLAQETFLRALRNLGSFTPGSNMRSWLLRIATNAFYDVQRQRKRRRTESLAEELPDRSTPVGRGLEVAEQADLVRLAMQHLSETTRTVFHLRATEDLPFREIGSLLGLSEEAARWHMHQARVTLLKKLGRDG